MIYITLFICWLAVLQATAQVKNGADRLEELFPLLENKRISLVVNQTSLVQNVHLLDTLYNKGVHITQVFAPEHGFRGDADAGEFIKNGKDYRTQVPIISLYGKNKKPQPAQLQQTDIVIFDIQDVGARFYTYISTMFYVMQACAENNKELIILDRPNPCDYIDGPVLDMKYKSFVGMLPIPVLHGCTIGELAQMINGEGWLGNNLQCPLKVITIEDWKHGQPYSLPVKPSPNLPNNQAIALHPSLCPFEGTSVSVGRGTDFPFQIIGSPTTKNLKFRFMPHSMKGSDKHPLHQDAYCYGLNLSSEKNIPKGFSLQYVIQFYNYFQNLTKHAEKEFFTRPHWFDLLTGTNQVRLDILKNKTEEQIRSAWQKKLNQYKEIRKKYLLYEDYPAM
ncbi:MAG: DUF1343 domain-containing protein [Bacteroides sp.]|nr:DUF1343 domain-containing protein [Bacteroides sp.]